MYSYMSANFKTLAKKTSNDANKISETNFLSLCERTVWKFTLIFKVIRG